MDTERKSKVVTSIDINLPPQVNKRQWLEESITDHLQCVLCGTSLEFRHKTDFIQNTVQEEAHCPACRVRNRQTTHSLQ